MASEVVVAPRKKIGRPGHLTPEVRERFITELRTGISVRNAARLADLNPQLVEKWIQRGRGHIPDRPASPEYVALAEAVEKARSYVVGRLAKSVFQGAEKDPVLALRILDRIDPDWMNTLGIVTRDRDDDDPDDRAYLTPGRGGAVGIDAPPPEEEPLRLTERERTISIPASRLSEFTRLIRGKGPDDPTSRLDRFRETEGDVPPT